MSGMDRLQRNNFDLLRLAFAGIVCLYHLAVLSGSPQLEAAFGWLSADLAVQSFFVVSGFLIFMSCERSASLASYAQKRVRRIYPAYATVVLLCAFGLVFASTADASGYFGSTAWWRYLAANLAFLNFLQPTLPGVFAGNPLPTVNGALWTLKIEVMFYASVPLFVLLFRRVGTLRVLALTYALSVAWPLAVMRFAPPAFAQELARQLPGQLCYFVAGAFFYYRLAFFEKHAGWFAAGAVAVLAVHAWMPLPALQPFALATLVACAGLFRPLGHFARHGDFSYGVYILHFPLVQLLVRSGWFRDDPWLLLAATVAGVGLAAFALWHLVEKRSLLRSSHYLQDAPRDRRASGVAWPPAAGAGPGRR